MVLEVVKVWDRTILQIYPLNLIHTMMHLSFRYRIQYSLGLKQHNFQIVDTTVMHLTFKERIQCSLGLKQHNLQNHISVKIKIH